MENFPSNNSEPDKAEREASREKKKLESIVTSKVSRRKKPLGSRIKEAFTGNDAQTVWSYVLVDVMVPAAKDLVTDAVTSAVRGMIYGEGASRDRGLDRGRRGTPRSNYSRYSESPTRRTERHEEPRNLSHRARATHDFDEIILETRVEAEEVIDAMFRLIEKFEMVTVADLYELIDVTGNFTDDKWGWVDIQGAGVKRVRDGYLLELPKPEPMR